jgi:hypothetical protein
MNGIDQFDALFYGTTNIKNYAGQIDPSVVNNFISPLAQQYVQEAVQRNIWYNSDVYYDQIRQYVHNKGPSIVHQDFITYLYRPVEFRTANLTMQRWIMAEPTVRAAYNAGQISGYESTYVDYEPGAIGDEHSDWRHVMNGVVVNDEANIYFDNYTAEKPKLSPGELVDILQTWSNAKLLMDNGAADITDPLETGQDDPTVTAYDDIEDDDD